MFAALNLNFISPDCYSECSDVDSLCSSCEIYITSRQSVFTNFGKEDEFRMRTTTTDNERISIKRAKLSFLFISLGFFVPLENYLFTHFETSSLPLKGSLFRSILDTLWSLSNEGSLAYHTNCDTDIRICDIHTCCWAIDNGAVTTYACYSRESNTHPSKCKVDGN